MNVTTRSCGASERVGDMAAGPPLRPGRRYPWRDGLMIVQETFTGKNRIAANFYNSDRWQQFRPLEQLFLRCFGGLPGARRQILRHLPDLRGRWLLEVGIGDGENVALLPRDVHIAGVDIAQRPLAACRDRFPNRGLFLALAEGEHLPFADQTFDAALCVGGFNFFTDPVAALAEMSRVVKPGGRIVVADELPNLRDYGWGHLLGFPQFDVWLMERFWFGPEFTQLALTNELDVAAVARQALGPHHIRAIWRGFGYCIVGTPRHHGDYS
ncbi:MAG: class I SAM-dependent methyltransferase [Gemmataceae bacterium]|nr:class I SAM-dependent methyltransferase [Gemmataceae bacterium]MDW8265362.1 class I SAM-dependent methyltransferase [Gemmataceae bacterium]